MKRLLLFVLLALCLFGCTTQPATTSTQPTPTATQPPSREMTPTPSPTQAPVTPTPNPHGDIGLAQTSGVWIITVNSVKNSTGDEFEKPKAGNIFVLMNFTAKNTDSANQHMSGTDFALIDSSGNQYTDTFLESAQKDYGDVVSGQQFRGDAVFEISKSLHHFTLQFNPSYDASQIVQWNIVV